jgi:hypothetical protein
MDFLVDAEQFKKDLKASHHVRAVYVSSSRAHARCVCSVKVVAVRVQPRVVYGARQQKQQILRRKNVDSTLLVKLVFWTPSTYS